MKSDFTFKFEELIVYQKAMDFSDRIHHLVISFPSFEKYALSSQFRRAADSIALNIAEGYPGSNLQFIKHINYAIFSANECVSCSSKAYRREYISFPDNELNRKDLSEITKMLTSLRRVVEKRHFKT